MNEKQQEKELKFGDWGVIDGPLMRDVLDQYLLNPDFSNKVLEIQRIKSIITRPRIRAFIGQKIKMTDYRAYNEDSIKSLEKLYKMVKRYRPDDEIEVFTNSIAAFCVWEDGPRISPLVRQDFIDHDECFYKTRIFTDMFGTSILSEDEKKDLKLPKINLDLSLWLHINDKGQFEIPALKTSLEPKFRVRAMDFETWKEITKDYISRGCVCPEYVEKDDITLNQINV